ncbi:hypothetical protein [Rhizobium tubonense]|nr:hypothetical protein [Rhizobium tubonense]
MPSPDKNVGTLKKRHGVIFQLILKRIASRVLKSAKTGAKEMAVFSGSIIGDLPVPANGSDVLLAACNDAYFRLFALDLIQSIELLGAPQAVHIHLLDPSDDVIREAESLRSSLKSVKLTFTADPCALARNLPHRQVYYTAARFLLAPLILKAGAKRLLIIDVDAVMNRSPWALFGAQTSASSGGFIFRRDMKRPWFKVLASAVFYNDSPQSIGLCDALARSLAATFKYRPKYHIDQILPYFVCTFAKRDVPNFETFDIPSNIMGYGYEADAAFWTVKGKSNIDRFLTERSKLLDSTVAAAI